MELLYACFVTFPAEIMRVPTSKGSMMLRKAACSSGRPEEAGLCRVGVWGVVGVRAFSLGGNKPTLSLRRPEQGSNLPPGTQQKPNSQSSA